MSEATGGPAMVTALFLENWACSPAGQALPDEERLNLWRRAAWYRKLAEGEEPAPLVLLAPLEPAPEPSRPQPVQVSFDAALWAE